MYKVSLVFDPSSFQLTLRVRTMKSRSSDEEQTGRGAIFSLLIDAIDTSLEDYKLGDSTDRQIPCSHCAAIQAKSEQGLVADPSPKRRSFSGREKDASSVFMFTYAECVEALINGDGVVFCHHIRSPTRQIDVQALAPDIGLIGVPVVDINFLNIQGLLGSGGFGDVYKGQLNQGDHSVTVAVKEANVSMEQSSTVYSDFRQEVFIMR